MKKPEQTRRAFLKGAAVTTAAVGTGAVATSAVASTDAEPKQVEKHGYRETDHVREYYRLARS